MGKRMLAELVKGKNKVRLYRSGPRLAELRMRRETTVPKGAGKSVLHADTDAALMAMAARIAELEAEGWEDTGIGLPPGAKTGSATAKRPVRPSKKKKVSPAKPTLDDAFAALARTTIDALKRSTTERTDAAAWKQAIGTYQLLRKRAGGDPTEHLVHFFTVDGVGVETAHPVVSVQVKPEPARFDRWMTLLQAAR
jgi:hypothetical protein